MTSITKHHCDFENAKCANKENESTNGKLKKPSYSVDSTFDWTKKEAINQQRKLRLVEVRQQSKQIASKIREDYRKEEQRQIEAINRIKKDELIKWREKQLGNVERDYQKHLDQIGSAHIAAVEENVKQKQFEEQKEKNRRLALKRGKIAAQKLKDEKMKPTKEVKQVNKMKPTKPEKRVTIIKAVESSPDTSNSSSMSSSSSSPSSSDSSVIIVTKKKKPEISVKTTTAAASKQPVAAPQKATAVKPKSPVQKKEYNPQRFTSTNNSTTDISLSDSPICDRPPFITKVSDLLDRKPALKPIIRSSPHIAKTYKLDKSPIPIRTTPKKTPQKQPINTVSSRLSRAIQAPSKTSGKSPMKVLPERKHFVPEFVKSQTTSTITRNDSMTPQRRSRVQFYDHSNRFSREYCGNIDLEETPQVVPPNAWDAAEKEIALDEAKRNKLLFMKQLAENRSKAALEKEKTRKDYELMSSQLSDIFKNNDLANSFVQSNELLSESRLRQLAQEKQQLMNNDFQKLLKKPAIITCPKVKPSNSQPPNLQHNPKSGEINIAKNKPHVSKTDASQIDDNSSDTTQSFLLDCANNICDDINKCQRDANNKGINEPKINELHKLLNQVNSFRRILCDEIKKSNGDISRIDTSQFMNEMSKVKEKQQEIMKDKPAETNKKQSKQDVEKEFKERERLLKIKESCIDERARELYLREKKILEQSKQSKKVMAKPNSDKNAIAVVTTNGNDALEEIPVRIVINVNKNEQNMVKPAEVVVNDIKWSEKLKKSSKENIQSVAVTNKVGKVYPKTPAKSNAEVDRQQLDVSSQTTSTTSYMNPPEAIETKLTKTMQKSTVVKKGTPSPVEQQQIPDTELLQYVIRMLGMSRASIEQLNMSSVSTVRTPNSSIINVSSNYKFISSATSTPVSQLSSASMEQMKTIDKAKLQQLARFLAENNKLGATPRRESKESGASSGVWDEILSKNVNPSSKSDRTETEKAKPHRNVPHDKGDVQDPDEKLSRNDLIAKYDELAASCTKRIINLDSMISKVREEKQKLLENTLSSASSLMAGGKDHATEYMEYPQPEQNQQAQQSSNNTNSPMSDSKGTNAPSSDFSSTSGAAETSLPLENRIGLFATRNKPFGESKDSGVGFSRPVTSSDYRESPDLKQNAKSADVENQSQKILQNALRESKKSAAFEPILKDIPKIDYNYSKVQQTAPAQEKPNESNSTNAREKSNKTAAPPVAITRYSPHIEDDVLHELSTITEVDTPATSRLNATDATNLNDTTLKNSSKPANESDVMKLLYIAFPNFKEYIKTNLSASQHSMVTVNESADVTVEPSANLDEKLGKILEPCGSQADQFKYKLFEGEDQRPQIDSKVLDESAVHMTYAKFPTHSEFAKSESGLLDSQSIDDIENTNSSLPDIVNELKNRKILEHSFEEADDDRGGNLEDLLQIRGVSKVNSFQTTQTNHDMSLSDVLENDLNSMGLSWVSAELKKYKAIASSTSVSSDSGAEKSHKSMTKGSVSPVKPRSAKRTHQKMNQSKVTNDSFVDKNIMATNTGLVEATATTQPTDSEALAKSINLKEFLARELLKHSSMSSSDSSLTSMFLKSYLGQSTMQSETTPNRGIDKHRTSTPVDHSSEGKESGRKKMFGTSSTKDSQNKTDSPTFFSNDSGELSSVRMSTTKSTTSALSEDQQK